MNNMASIRARAEAISDQVQERKMSPLEIGYVAVFASLQEAANQLRQVADAGLSHAQIREVADRLTGLAEDTLLLAEAADSR